ncbi:vesicular transporter [Daedalea quercina L-15889]|uniref:Vacuolar protein sorting-associated protein 51 homolog n=1 Tax=Daedalea quercina L-15889 TaxID=1314783 RepID=A0A165TLA7_9APHY|nr:vesicular transporter [Daedalea quercina L-15889]
MSLPTLSLPPRSRTPIPRPPSSPLRATTPGSPNTPTPANMRRISSTSTGTLPMSPPSGENERSRMSPPAAGERPKTRARDLLRKHYGLGVGPPPPLGSGAKAADPMDLDSAAFDAKAYYEQLITTSSLPSLLKRENDLLSEIRQLDSERQSLVYNHHHELIAASDTIAAMKSRADHLDADLDLLRAAFSEISRLSTEITGRDS